MTEKTEFSIDVKVDADTGFKRLPELVVFDLCQAYPMPGGKILLHNTRNGKRAMVQPDVYSVLSGCDQYRTIKQHLDKLIGTDASLEAERGDIGLVLQTMLDSGIMVSASETCNRLKSLDKNTTTDVETDGPVVVIITWERPQALQRLLKSMLTNCDTTKLHRVFVVDDSRLAENIENNQAVVEKHASEFQAPLHYFGQQEQRLLREKLGERLPQHQSAIDYLIDQERWGDLWTAGLSRNLSLLLSCGKRLVVFDDDTICDVFDPQFPKPNITISDSPREAEFFDNAYDWRGFIPSLNRDPVARHMQCLGLSFAAALNRLGENNLRPGGLNGATALMSSEIRADSKVLISECGSIGCPGTHSNTWLPDMAPVSLGRVLSSAKRTQNALHERSVWSGRSNPHFAPRSNMSQVVGLDNREMLPPYLPVMRGQDRLFGNMVDFIYPHSITLDNPWAVPHMPLPQRLWLDKERVFKSIDSFPQFFFEQLLQHISLCQAEAPEHRLAALSAWFSDMSSASDNTLIAMYRDAVLAHAAETLQHLSALLASAEGAPPAWKEYLQNGIDQLNTCMDQASGDDFEVRGVPAELEGEKLIAFWRDAWAGFAEALDAWPAIRAAAGEITTENA